VAAARDERRAVGERPAVGGEYGGEELFHRT
jgi:hypothetical protein